jgi:transcriptional regulator with XRE-family HTH domain
MMKALRQQRGLKQSDMEKRIGMTRQQYQRLEAKGNPRLETLELIASGLNSELMIIPKEKLLLVHAILNNELTPPTETSALDNHSIEHVAMPTGSHREEESLRPTSAPRKLSDSPWRGTKGPLGKTDE